MDEAELVAAPGLDGRGHTERERRVARGARAHRLDDGPAERFADREHVRHLTNLGWEPAQPLVDQITDAGRDGMSTGPRPDTTAFDERALLPRVLHELAEEEEVAFGRAEEAEP